MSSKIQGVREFMAECPLLAEIPLKEKHIDWTSENTVNYGINVDSDNVIRSFISGGGKCEYNFSISVRKFTKLDAERLKNNEFLERLRDLGLRAERCKKISRYARRLHTYKALSGKCYAF